MHEFRFTIFFKMKDPQISKFYISITENNRNNLQLHNTLYHKKLVHVLNQILV